MNAEVITDYMNGLGEFQKYVRKLERQRTAAVKAGEVRLNKIQELSAENETYVYALDFFLISRF